MSANEPASPRPEDNDKSYRDAIMGDVKIAAAIDGLANASTMIGTHYKQLKKDGIPEELARELTADFANKLYDKIS